MARAIKTKLYFAYGMNTNPEEMAGRCPTSEALGRAILPGYRFEFKTHATIVPSPGESVEGVLWRITDYDEQMLDILEGYPTYYSKKMVTVIYDSIEHIAMTYIMTPREQSHRPTQSYYGIVSEGYQHFGLSQRQLLDALPKTLNSIDFTV